MKFTVNGPVKPPLTIPVYSAHVEYKLYLEVQGTPNRAVPEIPPSWEGPGDPGHNAHVSNMKVYVRHGNLPNIDITNYLSESELYDLAGEFLLECGIEEKP